MAEIGKTVISRHRYSRIWGLGDRNNPISKTPGLVLAENEEMALNIAPFTVSSDKGIPRRISINSRGCFAPWVSTENGPDMDASIGHVLPPSFAEADAGQNATKGDILPISWQSMNHDEELSNQELNPIVVVLTDALQLANRPGKLVEAIVTIKHNFPGALLWAPGISGPDNCAVLAWFGIDLFDTARSNQALSSGYILTWNGPREQNENEQTVDHWDIAINEIRSAIKSSKLRELAVAQSLSSPRLVEHMRYHDKIVANRSGVLSSVVSEGVTLQINSNESHDDPVIQNWVNYISNEYKCPSGIDDVLILLPCSARKPYSMSKSHKKFRAAINHNAAHEVMVTSPLGLVPRDLEEVWPAGHYDIPVTGDWTKDEVDRISSMLDNLISRHNYKVIINHSGFAYDNDSEDILVINTLNLANGEKGRPTHDNTLSNLSKAITEHMSKKKRKGNQVLIDNYKSVARYHYLNDNWLEGCQISGRFPRWKIMKDNVQIGIWSPDRGGFSISKAGIILLNESDSLRRIEISSGQKWRGDVTQNIIESYDMNIKKGEDVLVMQSGKCVGSARALAPSWEWKNTPGKLAKLHQRL